MLIRQIIEMASICENPGDNNTKPPSHPNTLQESQILGNCVRCGMETNLCCENCKRTYYCSDFCQENDSDFHHYICTPNLEDMLMLKFELERTTTNFCWLSDGILTFCVQEDGLNKYFTTNIVHEDDNNKFICVCCGNRITYTGPLSDREFIFQKDDVVVFCYRCEECYSQEKIICHTTFRETEKCARMNKMRFIDFWLFASQKTGMFFTLPKEIVLMIFDMYSKLGCC